jgi:hypothetical protein
VVPPCPPAKRPRGRPRILTPISKALEDNSSDEEEISTTKEKELVGLDLEIESKRPAEYTTWFTQESWPLIIRAFKLKGYKLKLTLRYSKKRYVEPGKPPRFEKLAYSTMQGWFTTHGTFTKRVMDCVRDLDLGAPKVSLHAGRRSMWEEHQDLEEEFSELLVKVRQKNLILNLL